MHHANLYTGDDRETYTFEIDDFTCELSEREVVGVMTLFSAIISGDPHDYGTINRGAEQPLTLTDRPDVGFGPGEGREVAYALMLMAGDIDNMAIDTDWAPEP